MGIRIQSISYTHDAMIDEIIAEPSVSQNELARRFGYTASWISMVIGSDSFKERLHARKAEIVDPTLLITTRERFESLTSLSIDRLMEKLSAPAAAIDNDLLIKAANLGAKAMGVGGFSTKPAPIVDNPSSDRLDRLAGRLLGLMGGMGSSEIVDATPIPGPALSS